MIRFFVNLEDDAFKKLLKIIIRVFRISTDSVVGVSNLDTWVDALLERKTTIALFILVFLPHIRSQRFGKLRHIAKRE